MPFTTTKFEGLLLFEPQVFEDNRGYFFEAYNEKSFKEGGLDVHFVQDNQSSSTFGVIRGLHFQSPPYAQQKLVRVMRGKILDVVVDIRKGSPTYGKVYTKVLSAKNKRQLFVPKGFAHGFSVLSKNAVVLYKCDEFYNKESENKNHSILINPQHQQVSIFNSLSNACPCVKAPTAFFATKPSESNSSGFSNILL